MMDENSNVVAISVMNWTDAETINYFIPIKYAFEALNINQEEEASSKYASGEWLNFHRVFNGIKGDF